MSTEEKRFPDPTEINKSIELNFTFGVLNKT